MFKKLDAATTPAEMRAAIEHGGYDSPIIRNVMMMARRDGLTAEDAYSALAYYALQTMIDYQNASLEMLKTATRPMILQVADLKGAGDD